MINNEEIAKQVSQLLLNCGSQLDESVAIVHDNCPPEELHVYRRAVGRIMGDILLEVLNPIYEKHPNLKPPGLV